MPNSDIHLNISLTQLPLACWVTLSLPCSDVLWRECDRVENRADGKGTQVCGCFHSISQYWELMSLKAEDIFYLTLWDKLAGPCFNQWSNKKINNQSSITDLQVYLLTCYSILKRQIVKQYEPCEYLVKSFCTKITMYMKVQKETCLELQQNDKSS
jgi:hypothetical protein